MQINSCCSVYCTVHYCTVFFTVLFCEVLVSTVLVCTVLFCTVLYCLHCHIQCTEDTLSISPAEGPAPPLLCGNLTGQHIYTRYTAVVHLYMAHCSYSTYIQSILQLQHIYRRFTVVTAHLYNVHCTSLQHIYTR